MVEKSKKSDIKLSECQRNEIRELLLEGRTTYKAIASSFGVSKQYIGQIATSLGIQRKTPLDKYYLGVATSVTPDQVDEILVLLADGMAPRNISELLNIPSNQVTDLTEVFRKEGLLDLNYCGRSLVLSEDVAKKIVELRRKGHAWSEIQVLLALSYGSLLRHRRAFMDDYPELALEAKWSAKIPESIQLQIAVEYEQGADHHELCTKYNVSSPSVFVILKKFNVETRRERHTKLTMDQKSECYELRKAGWTTFEIAVKMEVSKTTVSRAIQSIKPKQTSLREKVS